MFVHGFKDSTEMFVIDEKDIKPTFHRVLKVSGCREGSKYLPNRGT